LTEAAIDPSVGSIGESHDNALAGKINGLYNSELVHCKGPWRNMQKFEVSISGWIDWFNKRGLLGPIGNNSPAEAE
tara:strand:+ start:18079 stop:18306 length:228 start_codon:yes stop_codon:yes gene_type:complete